MTLRFLLLKSSSNRLINTMDIYLIREPVIRELYRCPMSIVSIVPYKRHHNTFMFEIEAFLKAISINILVRTRVHTRAESRRCALTRVALMCAKVRAHIRGRGIGFIFQIILCRSLSSPTTSLVSQQAAQLRAGRAAPVPSRDRAIPPLGLCEAYTRRVVRIVIGQPK